MPLRPPPLIVDLSPPCRVDGQPARPQSVWLLARLRYAQLAGEDGVTAATVRARFARAADIRMPVSRAFADFRRWQVAVGWGLERGTAPARLDPARRSQGPFWLAPGAGRRLAFMLDGKRAGRAALARYLDLASAAAPGGEAQDVAAAPAGLGYALAEPAFWNHLTHAMRGLRMGAPGSPDSGMAAAFQAARRCAGDDFQHALVLLKESLAWRRNDELERCRAALYRFDRIVIGGGLSQSLPTFAAMAHVVRGWERYARGDTAAARAELDSLAAARALRPVLRYNPRVRFEYLNLGALLHKHDAIAATQPAPSGARQPRRRSTAGAKAAQAALAAFSGALQAAYEADSVEAAQHAAANLGWCLWLFWQHGLIDGERALAPAAVQCQAMRWLGLSEWICDRFGVGGGSAWNLIFLLRVARGNCRPADGSVAAFRAQQPLRVADAVEALRPFHAPLAPAKGFVRWSSAAAFAIEEHDSGHARLGALQLANLLLESAWHLTREEGGSRAACAAIERLARQVRALRPAERRFFADQVRAFPDTLRAVAGEAGGAGAADETSASGRGTRRRAPAR